MKIGLAFLVLVSLPLGMVVMAQNHSADEELVRRAGRSGTNRDVEPGPAGARAALVRDSTVNAPNNRVVVGRRAVLDTFVHAGIINFSVFERRIEHIRADGPFVFIMGLETVKPLRDAPSAGLVAGQTIERRFTNIWKNEDGTWRLFARHANVIPTP